MKYQRTYTHVLARALSALQDMHKEYWEKRVVNTSKICKKNHTGSSNGELFEKYYMNPEPPTIEDAKDYMERARAYRRKVHEALMEKRKLESQQPPKPKEQTIEFEEPATEKDDIPDVDFERTYEEILCAQVIECTAHELVRELRRRGWTVSCTKTITESL